MIKKTRRARRIFNTSEFYDGMNGVLIPFLSCCRHYRDGIYNGFIEDIHGAASCFIVIRLVLKSSNNSSFCNYYNLLLFLNTGILQTMGI